MPPRASARTAPRAVLVVTAAFLSLTSCSATRVAGEWRNPAHASHKFQRVFVLGVTHDALGRRLFEDAVVRRVKKAGGDAVASYTLLPSKEKLGEDDAAFGVKDAGADLVLVARLMGRRREYVTHHTADVIGPPVGRLGWYGYYAGSWETVHGTSFTTSHDVLELETQLFAASSQDLVWLASWETVVESSREKAMESFAAAVVDGLLHNLAAPKPPG